MRVTHIGRKISFGRYENLSMTCEVDEGENPHDALKDLERLMVDEINEREKLIHLFCEIKNLEYERDRVRQSIESRAKLLTALGALLPCIDVDEDELPF